MDYDSGNWSLSSPDDGYFLNDLRPAIRQKGHTRYFLLIFSSKTLSSLKFLTAKFFVQCYRVLLIFHRPDEWFTATNSSNIIIAFEELKDEGSDTVFHA